MARKNSKDVVGKVDLSRKKTKEFDIDNNIRVAYKTGKFIYGKNQVLKYLRTSPFKMLITSNNCPADLLNQLNYYNSLMKEKIHIHRYKGSSWDLGLTCAKPYMISVIGVVNEGDSDLLSLKTK
ncbi:MAG: 50S ribosomal protein L30e [Promethearchaeota archaeon]|jgi:large subunit ribosomal protein L30e